MELALHTLHLSHFRSHRSARIAGDSRPVTLVGANGAGKTNILEAISLLSPGRGLRRAATEDLARSPEDIGWKVSSTLSSRDGTYEVETWAEPGQPRAIRINGKTTSQLALADIVRMIWLVPAMDRLWSDGAAERRRFIDRAALSLDPSHGQASIDYEKAMRERNRLLKDNVRDPAWFDALENRMAISGAAITEGRVQTCNKLAAAQADAATDFPHAALNLVAPDDGPIEADPDALRAAFAESRSRDFLAGRTLIGPHRLDLNAIYTAKNTPARLCSTGEQKALLVSLVLSNARALAADFGAPPILLLDEVAAHLDENRRQSLYQEIRSLGAQAWMTGTDEGLFSPLHGYANRLEVRGNDGASQVYQFES